MKEAQLYLKSKGLTKIENLDQDTLRIVTKLAKDRILTICSSPRRKYEEKVPIDLNYYELDLILLSYPIAMLILSYIKDPVLTYRFATREARRAGDLLQKEPEDKLVEIARHTFEWEIHRTHMTIGRRIYTLALHFTDYVTAKPPQEPSWKLVNRVLVQGYVLLQKHELARLIEEMVKNRIISKIRNAKVDTIPESLERACIEILKSLEPILSKERAPLAKSLDSINLKAFPPCIYRLLIDAKEGKNLSHGARFALATFLLNVGLDTDEVVNVFRRMPDFKESITRYQVEHLAGLRGSKIKYSPPSCDTMKTFGLCFESVKDETCRRVKHPLTYYYLRMRGLKNARKDNY